MLTVVKLANIYFKNTEALIFPEQPNNLSKRRLIAPAIWDSSSIVFSGHLRMGLRAHGHEPVDFEDFSKC